MERDKLKPGTPMAGPLLQGMEQANREVCLLEKSTSCMGGECVEHSMAQTRGVCIPTVWTYLRIPAKSPDRTMHCGANCSCLENPAMVQQPPSDVLQKSLTSPKLTESSYRLFKKQPPATKNKQTDTSRLDCVRGLLQSEGVSARAAEIIFQQQRASTQRSYDCAWRKWTKWNSERDSNPLSPSIPQILDFLIDMFETGIKVGSIGIYRAALSSALPYIDSQPVGQHRRVTELIKGMTNIRPCQFKTAKSWNVDQVLETLISWGKVWELDIYQMTWKLAMLFALSSGGRCSELTALDTKSMIKLPDGIQFRLTRHKKNRRSSVLPGTIFIPSYHIKELCPVYNMNHYLIQTHDHRNLQGPDPDYVFRAITPPHQGVSPSTFSRWISEVIFRSGYSRNGNIGHSTRSKATSKSLLFPGFTIQQIMQQAEWKSESVFQHFYHENTRANFGKAVLHMDETLDLKG